MAEEAVAAAALQAEKDAAARAEADLAAAAERTRQMALRAAEEAEAERERMSAMSEAELVAMHLDTKVTSDLEVCAKDLEQTQATLKAVEEQESDLEQCLGANRNVMGSDISKVEEMIEGLDAALLVNVHFQEQSAALALQVDGEVVATSQKLLDHQSVLADRVNKELAEARHRLSAQTERQRGLQTELDKYKLSVETDMAKQSTELKRLNAIEATKRLNEEMWQSHLASLSSKLEELCQAKADHAAIRQKEEFVEETGRQVEALTQRIDDDEDKLRKWRIQEEEIAEAETLAAAAAASSIACLEADNAAVRSLIALQQTLLTDELSITLPQHWSVPAATDALASHKQPSSKVTLLEETRDFVLVQNQSCIQAQSLLDAATVSHKMETSENHDARQTALRLIRTERTAMEVPHEERKRFLAEKSAQLAVERTEVHKAQEELQVHTYAIEMLEAEVAAVQKEVDRRTAELNVAEGDKEKKDALLKQCKEKLKLEETERKSAIDAELDIQRGQQKYVSMLAARLKMESSLADQAARINTLPVEGTAEETELYATASAGKRGSALVNDKNSAHANFVEDLRARRVAKVASREDTRRSLVETEKTASAHRKLLVDKRAATKNTLAKQRDYYSNLAAKMPGSPSSASTPTLRSPRESFARRLSEGAQSPLTPSPQKEPAVSAPASPPDAGDVPLPPPRRHSHESNQSSPYESAHKYLAKEIQKLPQDEKRMSREEDVLDLLGEQNHPFYNPDLSVAGGLPKSSASPEAKKGLKK